MKGHSSEIMNTAAMAISSGEENIAISSRRHFSSFGVLNLKKEGALADRFIAKLRVHTPSRKQDIINLSGGNQQKVIPGRWLSEQGVKVLVIDEPTRGIDVGANPKSTRSSTNWPSVAWRSW